MHLSESCDAKHRDDLAMKFDYVTASKILKLSLIQLNCSKTFCLQKKRS